VPDIPLFVDDFESYNLTDLNGQGGWFGDSLIKVNNLIAYSGTKTVVMQSLANLFMSRNITSRTQGWWSARIRRDFAKGAGPAFLTIFADDSAGKHITEIGFHSGAIKCVVNSVWTVLQSSYNLGQWYKVELQWRSLPSLRARYRIDDGLWTSWLALADATATGIAVTAEFQMNNSDATTISYLDALGMS